MIRKKETIIEWLMSEGISEDKIVVHPNFTVDILGDLILDNRDLEDIPITFNIIHGNFNCSYNRLTQLPLIKEIKGELNASCNEITSIRNLPIVLDDIDLNNNELTTLKGFPEELNGGLYIFGNKLTSLEGCPKIIGKENGGDFDCSDNRLTSLEFSPLSIKGNFNISHVPLHSLKYCPTYIEENFICHNIPLNILKENIEHLHIKGYIKCGRENDINNELSHFNVDHDVVGFSVKEIHIPQHELMRFQLKNVIENNLNEKNKSTQPKI